MARKIITLLYIPLFVHSFLKERIIKEKKTINPFLIFIYFLLNLCISKTYCRSLPGTKQRNESIKKYTSRCVSSSFAFSYIPLIKSKIPNANSTNAAYSKVKHKWLQPFLVKEGKRKKKETSDCLQTCAKYFPGNSRTWWLIVFKALHMQWAWFVSVYLVNKWWKKRKKHTWNWLLN